MVAVSEGVAGLAGGAAVLAGTLGSMAGAVEVAVSPPFPDAMTTTATASPIITTTSTPSTDLVVPLMRLERGRFPAGTRESGSGWPTG